MSKQYLMDFCKNYITEEQAKQAEAVFHDGDKFLAFVVRAYNEYATSHKGVGLSLITNPDALCFSYEEENAFIEELKQYVRDVLTTRKREGATYGNNRTDGGETNSTQNKGRIIP